MCADWFDEKYREGGKASLEDKFELLGEMRFKLNQRDRENVERELKNALFELKQRYTPSRDVLAYSWLCCFQIVNGISDDKKRNYLEQYKEIIRKHEKEGDVTLEHNFG